MFHQSARPSRVLHKAFAIRCPSTALSQDTRALTEQVASQAHQPSKSNINLRSATWTSKSQCPIHDVSLTSRATSGIYSSSKQSSCLSTTPPLLAQALETVPAVTRIGQEKFGYHIRGQKCRRDTLRLHNYRSG